MSSDWDQRQLCPDGGCIGVIGADGACKVCGRAAPNWGDERTRGMVAPDESERLQEERVVTHATPAAPDDFDDRELCPDGACLGLIAADGCCNVCGRARAAGGPG